MSTESNTSVEGDLEAELLQSHVVSTDGRWESGQLQNFRVQPELVVHASVVEDSSKTIGRRVPSLENVYVDRGSKKQPVTKKQLPFFDIGDHRRFAPPSTAVYLPNVEEDVVEVTEYDDLFTVETGRHQMLLIPIDRLSRGQKVLATVEYNIIADLTADAFLKPQEVVLRTESSITDVKELLGDTGQELKFEVKYKYEDDSLTIQTMRDDSYNLIQEDTFNLRFEILQVVSFIGLYALGLVFAFRLDFIQNFTDSMLLTAIAFILSIVVSFKGSWMLWSTGAAYVKNAIRNTSAKGVRYADVDSPEDTSGSIDYGTAVMLYQNQQAINAKAEELAEQVERMPREVTVTATGKKLQAKTRNVSWKLSTNSAQLIDEDALEFFIDYGVDRDVSEFETHMVKVESVIPSEMPSLESTSGDWYLLPKKLPVDAISNE